MIIVTWMICLDSVVKDGDGDALAGVALKPGGLHVHVGPVNGATVQEPLISKQRIWIQINSN